MAPDPRIIDAMRPQLAARQAVLDAGAQPLGWKLGFGSPAAMAQLGTSGPLVGFLTSANRLGDGATVAIGGWTAPRLEPELAIRVDADGAIEAVAVAIELADIDGPGDDAEAILAANVFQRHVLLGPPLPAPTRPAHSAVTRDGAALAASDEPLAAPGDPAAAGLYVADVLRSIGAPLQGGEWIITGTIVPPIPVDAARYEHRLDPLGALSVTLT